MHPGAVGTEQQKGATRRTPRRSAKPSRRPASFCSWSKEQGAESALWAGTSPAVARRKDEVQGRYFTEADGKVRSSRPTLTAARHSACWGKTTLTPVQVDTESDQAKDKNRAEISGTCASRRSTSKAGYDVKLGI